ncbi:hypothetical protein [Chitinophaga sp. 22620]|uniref:hypothetical protein n=1 Tax=Chitinophaga sp. 22620 TaxID=3453952 RepID=UPI003F838F0C
MKPFAAIPILALLILSHSFAKAQQSRRYVANSTYKDSRAFGVTVIAGLAAPARIRSNYAGFAPESTPQPAFEGLLNWYREIDNNYWLVISAGAGVGGYNFRYYIPKETTNPPLQYDLFNNGAPARSMDMVYVKIPVELEKRWSDSKRNLWNASFGISLLYAPYVESGSESLFFHNGAYHSYLNISQQNNESGKPWFHLHAAGGYAWKLRNKHLVRANLKVSCSLRDYVTADYQFTLPEHPVMAGSYTISGSYAGMALSYIFAR